MIRWIATFKENSRNFYGIHNENKKYLVLVSQSKNIMFNESQSENFIKFIVIEKVLIDTYIVANISQ